MINSLGPLPWCHFFRLFSMVEWGSEYFNCLVYIWKVFGPKLSWSRDVASPKVIPLCCTSKFTIYLWHVYADSWRLLTAAEFPSKYGNKMLQASKYQLSTWQKTKHRVFHGRCGSLWPSPSLLLCLCGIRQAFLSQRSMTCEGALLLCKARFSNMQLNECSSSDAWSNLLGPAVLLGYQLELFGLFYPSFCIWAVVSSLLCFLATLFWTFASFCPLGFQACFGVLIWMLHGLSPWPPGHLACVGPISQAGLTRVISSLAPIVAIHLFLLLNLAVLLPVGCRRLSSTLTPTTAGVHAFPLELEANISLWWLKKEGHKKHFFDVKSAVLGRSCLNVQHKNMHGRVCEVAANFVGNMLWSAPYEWNSWKYQEV